MRKSLIALTIAGSILAGVSCMPQRKFVEGTMYNTTFDNTTQKSNPHKLEEVIMYNERFYILTETSQEANTLPMKFAKWETTHRVYDPITGKTTIAPEKKYVAKKLEDGLGGFCDNIELFDAKANVNKKYLPKIGYTVVTTEKDVTYAIPTVKINKIEYYYFLLQNEIIGLVPKTEAKIDIKNECGNIAITTKDNVYILTEEKENTANVRISSNQDSTQINSTNAQNFYIVKQGDNLSKIARENNISVKILMQLNPQITDFNKINVGQQINLK